MSKKTKRRLTVFDVAVLFTVGVVLLMPTVASAKSGSECRKQGAIDSLLGLKCQKKGKSLRWVQFYAVPGRISSVTFSRSSNLLSWSGPMTWGNPLTSVYAIEIKSSISPNWRRVADVAVGSNTANISGLEPNVTYEFRVAAGSRFGLGEFSTTGPVTTGASGGTSGGVTQSTTASSQSTTTVVGRVTTTTTSTTTTPTTTTPTTTTTTTTTLALVGTVSQRNAVAKGASYLRSSSFSRTGLIEQLQYEGFSIADATYGTDAQGADWNAQAVKKGASYLRSSSFSRSGLISQLQFEDFSLAEATYGTNAQGADWNAQAAKKAASYLRSGSFSRSGLLSQLLYEGFSQSEAEYGVSTTGL